MISKTSDLKIITLLQSKIYSLPRLKNEGLQQIIDMEASGPIVGSIKLMEKDYGIVICTSYKFIEMEQEELICLCTCQCTGYGKKFV